MMRQDKNRDIGLAERFAPLVLELQADTRIDVRRFVVSFLEDCVKQFPTRKTPRARAAWRVLTGAQCCST